MKSSNDHPASAVLVAEAETFARAAHAGHTRKDAARSPYAAHLEEVADFVARHGGDSVAVAAAWLHDTVEDVSVTLDELRSRFGPEVASVVAELTDDKALPKAERKRLQLATAPKKTARAALIKVGDKTSNVRAVALTPPDWSQDRKAGYVSWARSVVGALPKEVPAGARAEFEAACALHPQVTE